jgi:small-conductance mechanosensitive channel
MFSDIYVYFEKALHNNPVMMEKVIPTILVVISFWILKTITYLILSKQVKRVQNRYRLKKTMGYIYYILLFFILGRIWLQGFHSITTILGLFSAGLAIALKDLFMNVAGFLYIMWQKPFEVGDRVQLGTDSGDVIDQRFLHFTILEVGNWVDHDQSTGRVIHVPNHKVFTDNLANYNKGFQYIWNEIPVLITFESDWKKAKKLLETIANKDSEPLSTKAQKKVKEAAQKFMIMYSKLTPIVYTDVKESGVMLTIRHLCEPRKRREASDKIWEDILNTFAKHKNISLAYPTTRFFQ